MRTFYPAYQIKWLIALFTICLGCEFVQAQEKPWIVDKSWDGLSWTIFVQKAENEFKVKFYYQPDSLAGISLSVKQDGIPLEEVLTENLTPLFNVAMDASGNIFITKWGLIKTELPKVFFAQNVEIKTDSIPAVSDSKTGFLQTNKEYVAKTVVIGNRKDGMKTTRPVLSGQVRSASDGSPIVSGNLYIEELERGTTTDENGYYNITLKKGTYTLIVSSLESEDEKYKIELLSSGKLNIDLIPKSYMLNELVVSSEKEDHIKGTQMGFEKINTKNIKEVPVVLGERDIIKIALLLPGVQTVGEGATGFNVRGSPADQNQFYINQVPVYNSSHLFGFFSAFNSDAISNFTLLKSNIPADYGGRLSSIFDITARTGDFNKFTASGGISPVTARIVAEGPMVKEKSSYMVGLRSTYSNWILRSLEDPELRGSKAYFGDAIANFAFKLNRQNELKVFSYFSYDDADISTLSQNNYTNMGGAINWRHYFKERNSFDVSLTRGSYAFDDKNLEYEQFAYEQSYQLVHSELKANAVVRPNDSHTLSFGVNSILYESRPGDFLPGSETSTVKPEQFEPEKGLETGIFISDEWKITTDLLLTAGLRFNTYSYLGPKTVYTYQAGAPKSPNTVQDTLHFSNNDVIKTYNGLDYRLGARYIINDQLSVKGSYNRLHQYIFMLSNTIAISPTDAWKLADYNIKPMTGDQYSLGLYSSVMADLLEISVEGYYKDVQNLVEFKDGAQMVANETPETEIVQGGLDAWGLEFMIKKPYGRLNGWVNYTYSKATVLVNNDETGESNNFGNPYPANYDKPHAFNLVANYKFSKRFSFSGNLVYSTGRPITYPTAIYYQDGIKLIHYSGRNEYRLPDYFRIDISFNLEGNLKSKKFAHGSWNFSVYNLTGRNNAYSVYFKSENGQVNGYKLSIFGSPIISITYNFKLGNYDN